ncbi:MAG: fructosamine kinase family protein [Saccharospirillum sp.]
MTPQRSERLQPYPPWRGQRRAFQAVWDRHSRVFVKEDASAPSGFFAAEQLGLRALAQAGARVPEVVSVGDDHILLEWIEPGNATAKGMADLGQQLATVHAQAGSAFGFACTTWCGEGRQDNRWMDKGHEFFAQRRLLPLATRATQQGLLKGADMDALERLCARLESLIPDQPPVLIHGDLWSGNALVTVQGQGVLIDPAVSWGWAEADLAMTALFGGFDADFYRAYRSMHPLEPGFEQRQSLYNLYHLLNHLVIFGAGYLDSVRRVLRRYA